MNFGLDDVGVGRDQKFIDWGRGFFAVGPFQYAPVDQVIQDVHGLEQFMINAAAILVDRGTARLRGHLREGTAFTVAVAAQDMKVDEPAQTGLKRLEEKGKLTDFSHIGIGL